MSRTTLTEARIRALKPRKTAYVLRDTKLRGFGVRMLPSGRKRFFVHCQHRGERVWKIVGDAATMDVREARSRATAMLAAIRRGEDVSCETAEGLFEAVAETVFRRHERVWKSGTLYVNRCYLRNQLLPHFAGRRIADIGRDDVRNWFASLHATPVAADLGRPPARSRGPGSAVRWTQLDFPAQHGWRDSQDVPRPGGAENSRAGPPRVPCPIRGTRGANASCQPQDARSEIRAVVRNGLSAHEGRVDQGRLRSSSGAAGTTRFHEPLTLSSDYRARPTGRNCEPPRQQLLLTGVPVIRVASRAGHGAIPRGHWSDST